ncbi:MAG: hypothetical protein RMY29_013730 [Nostoc sp. CreGUA01]|nr:hypothetical protein [Nostoc sp. CreGUA01]
MGIGHEKRTRGHGDAGTRGTKRIEEQTKRLVASYPLVSPSPHLPISLPHLPMPHPLEQSHYDRRLLWLNLKPIKLND